MRKGRKLALSLICTIFPFVCMYRSNRKVSAKIKEPIGILHDVCNKHEVSKEVLQDRYSAAQKMKEKLEDKAKANIFAVTVSVTLIMNASTILNTIASKYPSSVIQWGGFSFYIAAIIYLIIAGVISIRMLMHKHIIDIIDLNSYANEDKLRDELSAKTEMNQNRNIIRNNDIFSAYECIRNALVCLFVVFFFAILPFEATEQNSAYHENTNNIFYSSEATAFIQNAHSLTQVESAIHYALNQDILSSEALVGFIDPSSKLFIQASKNQGMVYIHFIASYHE